MYDEPLQCMVQEAFDSPYDMSHENCIRTTSSSSTQFLATSIRIPYQLSLILSIMYSITIYNNHIDY